MCSQQYFHISGLLIFLSFKGIKVSLNDSGAKNFYYKIKFGFKEFFLKIEKYLDDVYVGNLKFV